MTALPPITVSTLDRERLYALLEKHRQEDGIDAVLMTGGTGISSRDQTFETVQQLISRPLPGYGELVRMLSYHDIGPAAMLSSTTLMVFSGWARA